MFRGRPMRFVLPIHLKPRGGNLVRLENSNAEAYVEPDGSVFVHPEMICDMGCETPRINYNEYLGIVGLFKI